MSNSVTSLLSAANTGAGNPAAVQPTKTTGTSSLGANDFMSLLSAQLQNQDPLKPMDDTAFVSQMASFTSLQQMQTLNTNFSTFTAQNYIGKQVSLTDPATGNVSGIVTGVQMDSTGAPQIVVNGKSYDPKTVTNIVPAPAASTTDSTDATTTPTTSTTTN